MKDRTLLKYATVLGMGGLMVSLLIGGIDPKTGFPDPITVNGQTIEFTWTDDNTDEDLIIYTDKATYTNGVASADVYVTVENRSGRNQNIELMGYFRDSKQRIKDISVLTEVTTEEPVYTTERKCWDEKDISLKNNKNSNLPSDLCGDVQVQTATTTVTKATWRPLAQLERTELEKNLETTKLTEKVRKPVEGFIAEKKSSLFTVPTGGVAYYKVLVEFPAGSEDNFYFEAVGDQGGYGHLDPWFNASWTYRVKLEVVPAKVGTTSAITSFPVYVDLSDLPAGFHNNVKADGCDIRIVESDDTTETAFELVTYATSTDTGELHFMADALSTTSTSTFYMYYGNSGASCYANTDTYGRNNVWTAYAAVYHLNTSSGDSTVNALNGTDTSVSYSTTTGKLRGGASFNGSTSIIDLSNSSLLNFATASYSLSAWAQPRANTTLMGIVSRRSASSPNAGYGLGYDWTLGDGFSFVQRDTGTNNFETNAPSTSAINNWYHVVGVYDSAIKYSYVYVDTAQGSLNSATRGSITSTEKTYVSALQSTSFKWNGYIDELRIKNATSSQAWVVTEYNNQSNPDTFYYIGPEETDTPAVVPVEDSSWFN